MTKLSTSIFALATIFAAGSALAADLKGDPTAADYVAERAPITWTGFYIGGQVGLSNSNHNLSAAETRSSCAGGVLALDGKCYDWGDVDHDTGLPETDAVALTGPDAVISRETLASAFLDGVNSSGFFGGGTIGADYQMNRVVVGVFGDYNFSNADATAGATIGVCPDCLSADASIEDGDSWVVAARLGYLLGAEKRALFYVLAGYGQQDVSYNAGATGSADFNKDLTFSGFVAGAGAEYALSQNVAVSLEWQHFFGGKEDLFNENEFYCPDVLNTRISDELDTDKIMAKLKIKLNGASDLGL